MRYKPVINPSQPSLVWCSKHIISKMDPDPNIAVISIVEPEDSFMVPEGWNEVLRLRFHDAEPNDSDANKLQLFDGYCAHQIMAFLKRNASKSIIIHCHAGMSRSAAVARFASEFLNREPVGLVIPTTQFANSHVLAVLHREAWKIALNKG